MEGMAENTPSEINFWLRSCWQ